MSPRTWLVFINLFLIPLLFHPFIVCRHMIHIGHEPYHLKPLSANAYETSMFNIVDRSRALLHRYSGVKQENIFQRVWNFLLRLPKPHAPRTYFYPNLISYTLMYIRDHDLSPFIQSFVLMYISYFILTYTSSLMHVYRMSRKRKSISTDEVRTRIAQLMESSYLRWIIKALGWKSFAVVLSHPFHVLAVKIMMQSLFLSYGHFQLEPKSMYSWWNMYKNLNLIYHHEQWTTYFSGILPRLLYELGELIDQLLSKRAGYLFFIACTERLPAGMFRRRHLLFDVSVYRKIPEDDDSV